MNKQDAFIEINKLQDEYVDELIGLINSAEYSSMKAMRSNRISEGGIMRCTIITT